MSPLDRALYDFLFVSNTDYASILYRFRDTASYLSTFANNNLHYLHFDNEEENERYRTCDEVAVNMYWHIMYGIGIDVLLSYF